MILISLTIKRMENKMKIKEQLNKIIENIDDNSNWDDVMYQIYVIQSIEEGISQVEKNEVISFEEVKENFNANKVH